ncbi:MAG: metallophosphoesterase [Clostridia bacterium]|nr:metallophosphoesterase [Clostridia bacterium]
MALFAISDLHLSFSCEKPMDIFHGWDNYTERIKANWCRIVKEEDTVVLPGDFSWGLKLEETLDDFKFLDALPGKKLILKGNHDLWWSTRKKVEDFFAQNNITTISLVFNNSVKVDDFYICGTRGWFFDDTAGKKVLLREAGRLDASIKSALDNGASPHQILVFLHYPPVYDGKECEEIWSIIKKYDVKRVFYGHIHGAYNKAVSEYEGVNLKLISCDRLEFTPIQIKI